MEPSHNRNFQSSSGRHRNYDAAQHPASHDVDSDFTMDDFTVDAHENDRTSHHTDSEHDAAGPADQGDARTDTRCLTIWPKGIHEITSRTMFGRAGTPHVEQISQMLERCKVQDGQEQAKEYRYAAGKFMKYMHALGDIEQKLSPGADGRPQRARVMKTLFLVGEAEFPELFGFESPEIVVQERLRDGLISQADLDGAQAAEETFSGHPVLDIHNERTRFFDALGIHSRPLAVMYDLQQSDGELFDHDFVTGSSQTQEIREVPAGTEVDTHVEQSENNDVHEHAQHFRGCAQLLLLDCDGLFDRHDVRNITNAINFKLLNTKTADEYKKLIKAELAMPFRFPGHPLFREAMQGSKLSRHVALLAYHAIVSAKCLVTFVLNISARLYQIRKQQSHQALKKARTNERKHFHSVNQDANGLLFSATETLAKILTEKADAADRRAAEETNLEGLVLILRDIAVDLTQDQLDTLRTYQELRAAVAQLIP